MTLAAASGDNSRSLFATPAIVADRRADGSILVRSTVPLQSPARCIGDWLEHWARAALAAIKPLHSATVVSGVASDADAIPFRSIAATPATPDVEKAFAAITPDTIAKFLFTSGSTGTPKAVINTQRMLTSSQQAKAQTWTFLDDGGEKLVILDWLPWSHTFGAKIGR